MKRCSSPDHPHCTLWVAPDAAACAHGHAQPAAASAGDPLGASIDLVRSERARQIQQIQQMHPAPRPAARPHLRVSGFDPRAAGGRQAIRLELRGMPDDLPAEIALLLQSDLLPGGGGRQRVTRARNGAWLPLIVEFSSRGREHGQYRVDLELHARGSEGARTWVATLLLLVPRPDTSLGEIHQTFLSMHKNVRISADDAAIARVHGLDAAGPLDLDIGVRNASIAQIYLGQPGQPGEPGQPPGGRSELALPTIAWDEDLVEIDLPAAPMVHPCPASGACLVYAEPDAGFPRHLRLFALDECVLGRFEAAAPEADLLLMHHEDGAGDAHGGMPRPDGLTRRLSARHAVIRPARGGFEIEDVSRYGVLLDGVWPGKHVPVPLRLGMRVELTASIRGVVVLVVTALLPHAAVLHRVDAGGAAECFVLCAPERTATVTTAQGGLALPRAAGLPLLFHRDGGFWHLDPASGAETALGPATALDRLAGFAGRVRFAASPRPEDRTARGDDRRQPAGSRARLLDA
jgi:hypothetical protein